MDEAANEEPKVFDLENPTDATTNHLKKWRLALTGAVTVGIATAAVASYSTGEKWIAGLTGGVWLLNLAKEGVQAKINEVGNHE